MKIKSWLSLGIFVLLTLIITWPLILHPASLSYAAKEEFLLSYLMNWNIHALTHFPLKIFQVPFYHPTLNTLAFSDPLITSSLLALPLVTVFKQPFLAYNFNLFLSFILNGFFTYLLVHKITKNFFASLVAGVLFTFSIGRIDTLEHLQVLSIYWLPLGLYFLLDKRFFLVSLCFLFQTLNTIFLGYVYGFSLVIFSFVYWLKHELSKPQLINLVKYLSLSLFSLCLIFIPYWRVSQTYQYTRSLKDIKSASVYFLEYFYPTSHSRLQSLAQQLIFKQPWPGYLGLPISILGIIAIIYFLKCQKTSFTLSAVVITFTGFVLSLGPYFQLIKNKLYLPIPLPYWLGYYLIPGFKSMRVPQRWSHLVLFGLSLLIGLWFKKQNKKIKLFSMIIILLVVLEIKFPLFIQPVPLRSEIPSVYHWLSKQPSSVILELPAQTWVMPLSNLEIQRLHFHSFFIGANHKFINGYSGFEPPSWTEAISLLRTSSPEKTIGIINDLGAQLIVVHHQELNQLYQKDKEALPLQSTLETIDHNYPTVYEDKTTSVYQI